MKTAYKLLTMFAVMVVGVLMNVDTANAGLIKTFKAYPYDTRPDTATSHVFSFSTESSTDIREVRVRYCTLASAPSDACTAPTGLDASSITLAGTAGEFDANWTLASATANSVVLQDDTGVNTVNADSDFNFTISNVTNATNVGSSCPRASNNSSITCYVRLETYANISQTNEVDSGTATITFVASVTVTATVDPTFTFVVDSVDSGTVNSQITTSVTTTYTTLPFGNLTANTPKYAAHTLTVTTNTQAGYTVTSEMLSQMTGVYSGNNIDPYGGTSWGSENAWTQPTGTSSSVDTGWVGMNTTDTDVFSSPNGLFGPTEATAHVVSSESDSDPGNTIYVTYAIEANVYQPADSYTGTLQYTALPTY